MLMAIVIVNKENTVDFTIEAIKTTRNGKKGFLVTKVEGLIKEELPRDYIKLIDVCYIDHNAEDDKFITYFDNWNFYKQEIYEGSFYTKRQYKRIIKLIKKSVKKLKRINMELEKEKTEEQVSHKTVFNTI